MLAVMHREHCIDRMRLDTEGYGQKNADLRS